MQKQRLVVIGNGMVGYKFCESITEKAGIDTFDITVFGDEPRPAYDRVHLSAYFDGKTASDLEMAPREWYKEQNINLCTGDLVTEINREEKYVVSQQGKKVFYDKLILSTGSGAFVPPVPGISGEGIFVYRTIEDLEEITEYSKKSKSAVVIGGGLLGLEAAKAMVDLKLKTHVVEMAPRLMPRQLNNAGAELLKNKIEDLGVSVHLSKFTKDIVPRDNQQVMRFKDDSELPVDMIVVSAGISPRDELARTSGLEVGKRAGIVVNSKMETSDPNIFAIGECALYEGMVYGLVAPGFQMAEVVSSNLMGGHEGFFGADMSTKLKLMGIDVASFGDALQEKEEGKVVTIENYVDGIYKQLVLSKDGHRIQGGILVGDASDYGRLLSMYQADMPVPKVPESLLLPATGDDKEGFSVAYLPASAVVCSCNNVTKGDLVEAIRNGEATDINDLKQCTKGGSGCGGCVPLMKDILNLELENIGVKVDTSLCEHFAYDRSELRALVKENKIYRFEDVLSKLGQGQGCETCRPAVASILAGCWGEHVMNNQNILDTNDYLMANMQKNGTYSVVPRAAGGEITPDQLIAIGQVAKDFNLYSKITGGQRIDLFGARREDLPKIWKVLIDAGLESGLAYGKSLRTVKSCVGSTWCRFGVQDSVAFAIELENRYKGLRAPHKVKGGVSGCIRECAEARGKDFGVIATDKGWNLYICGNGGAKPQHAELLAADIDKETLIQYLDRFLMYYVRTAPHLSRTSTWLVNLDGGMDHVKDVVINDSLGLAEELEAEMQNIVDNYECEWKRAIEDPEKLKRFNPYLNSDASDDSAKFVEVRGQKRPATPEEVEAMTKKKKSAVVA